MKDLYREETNQDVYADYCCERPAGSYADEYVHWLEAKLKALSQHDVIETDCGCDGTCHDKITKEYKWCRRHSRL